MKKVYQNIIIYLVIFVLSFLATAFIISAIGYSIFGGGQDIFSAEYFQFTFEYIAVFIALGFCFSIFIFCIVAAKANL